MPAPTLWLGDARPLDGKGPRQPHELPAHHLVTHGVVVGMTGSGKTGLLMVMAEEAMAGGIPLLAIDVKGDLPNLLLAFPSFAASAFAPWAASGMAPDDLRPPAEVAAELARKRQEGSHQARHRRGRPLALPRGHARAGAHSWLHGG